MRQSEMLEKIGIARTTWSSYENGISQPDIDGILRIAHFFGITSTELLETDLNAVQKGKETEVLVGKLGLEQASGEHLSVTGQMLFEVIMAKQRVIDNQTQTIRTLQALIAHLSLGDRSAEGKGGEQRIPPPADGEGRKAAPGSRLH